MRVRQPPVNALRMLCLWVSFRRIAVKREFAPFDTATLVPSRYLCIMPDAKLASEKPFKTSIQSMLKRDMKCFYAPYLP
uniref:Uncharacterized protein n=1 Tax=uncultured Rhodospirillales bacterium HF0070_31K06 TaxID=710786 RepID=E0XSN5_9PROT|nr:hypothetical protein [uncultured Rhodospirillales bacterium HF0070_31K06]